MTIETAVMLLLEQYEHDRAVEQILDPVAHALYEVWRRADIDSSRVQRRMDRPVTVINASSLGYPSSYSDRIMKSLRKFSEEHDVQIVLSNEWKANAIKVFMRKDDRVAVQLIDYAVLFEWTPEPTLNAMLAALDEDPK